MVRAIMKNGLVIRDFVLLDCPILRKRMFAADLTALKNRATIQLWCSKCNHFHEYTLVKQGLMKIKTTGV